jgi:hypothetical protein
LPAGLTELTPDTSWAKRPLTTFYYVDSRSGLCAIKTDSSGQKALTGHGCDAYQFKSPDGWFIYGTMNVNTGSCSFLRRPGDSPVRFSSHMGGDGSGLVKRGGSPTRMSSLACNQPGTLVAFIGSSDHLSSDSAIYIVEPGSGRWNSTKEDSKVAWRLFWSRDPSIILLDGSPAAPSIKAYRVDEDLSLTRTELESPLRDLPVVLGRFGPSCQEDEHNGATARITSTKIPEPWYSGPTGVEKNHCLLISTSAWSWKIFADDPRLPKVERQVPGDAFLSWPGVRGREFRDVFFAGNGSEVVLSDDDDIYLVDIERRRAGRIARGRNIVGPASRYRNTFYLSVAEHERSVAEHARARATAIAEITRLGGKLGTDDKSPGHPIVSLDLSFEPPPRIRSHHSLLGMIGASWDPSFEPPPGGNGTRITDDQVELATTLKQLRSLNLSGNHVTDEGVIHLLGLPELTALSLRGTYVTDRGLACLTTIYTPSPLKDLEYLDLSNTVVTDDGLRHIKEFGKLQTLILRGTKVKGPGLEHLQTLTKLRSLDLTGTDVSDADLRHLRDLKALQSLKLENTRVTNAAVERLRQALPTCTIHHSNRNEKATTTGRKSDGLGEP